MKRKSFPRKDKRAGSKRESGNIPDELDLKLWREEYEKLSKKLDVDGKRKPITETELIGWVRKKLDEVWMSCDVKLAFLESQKVPDYEPTSRRRAKWCCNLCKNWFGKTDVQVDHIEGEHEFTKLGQLTEFANKRFMVGSKDLQILCVPCHQLKTLAERNGSSLEEARIEKELIAIMKTKKEKEWLLERGIEPASNAAKRKIQVREQLILESKK